MDIILATHNQYKLQEFKDLLSATNINLISLPDINDNHQVDETGLSFKENAFLKASYYSCKYQKPVIADDSGIVVPGIDYKPGIYSARYAGTNASDDQNNKKLLEDTKNLINRDAYFICVICYIENNQEFYFEGRLNGKLATDIEGSFGFGYDPIFILEDGTRLADLTRDEKNNISHRYRAFKKWLEFFQNRNLSNTHN